MVVMEMCYSRYSNALLALVVEEKDMCSALLPVEEVYLEFLNLLDDDE